MEESANYDPKDATGFVVQGNMQGIRDLSRVKVNLSSGSDGSLRKVADISRANVRAGFGVFEIPLPFRGAAFRVVKRLKKMLE